MHSISYQSPDVLGLEQKGEYKKIKRQEFV